MICGSAFHHGKHSGRCCFCDGFSDSPKKRVKGYVYRCNDTTCGEDSRPFREPSTRGVVCQCGSLMHLHETVWVYPKELVP